jgi:hypothetical protein
MARTTSTSKKPTTKKAAASTPSNMAPSASANESSEEEFVVTEEDIAALRGEINGIHATTRTYHDNAGTWAAESRRRFDAIDARLDKLERLVRETRAAVSASGAQLRGVSVDQAAPVSEAGENVGGEDPGERDEEEEEEDEEDEEGDEENEEEEDEGEEEDEEAEEESASPDEVMKGTGVYTRYTYSDEPVKETWGILPEGRRISTIKASEASEARDNVRKTKRKRKASKSGEDETSPTPQKTSVLPSIEESEEDGPQARNNDAFTTRIPQVPKGKKRKNEQSDAAQAEDGKLKSASTLLNDQTDSDTDDEDKGHQPQKKASRKEPEPESEADLEETPTQKPKKGKQDKISRPKAAERKK